MSIIIFIDQLLELQQTLCMSRHRIVKAVIYALEFAAATEAFIQQRYLHYIRTMTGPIQDGVVVEEIKYLF